VKGWQRGCRQSSSIYCHTTRRGTSTRVKLKKNKAVSARAKNKHIPELVIPQSLAPNGEGLIVIHCYRGRSLGLLVFNTDKKKKSHKLRNLAIIYERSDGPTMLRLHYNAVQIFIEVLKHDLAIHFSIHG